MKLFNFTLMTIAALGLISSASFAAPRDAGYVPKDWFALPEDGGTSTIAPRGLSETFTQPDSNLGTSLQRIFSAQRDALTSVKAPAVKLGAPSDKPADWVPWRFAFFASDLSISAGGLIGVLGFKGTPSVQVHWVKKDAASPKAAHKISSSESSKDAPAFVVDESASKQQLEKQVDAIHRTVIASGRVQDSKHLRSELSKTVHRFHDMTKVVSAADAETEWYPARLRLDIEISATGRVKWGTVGGDVKLRLEWFRIQGPAQRLAPIALTKLSPTQSSLRDLVGSVTEDLVAASSKAPAPHFWAADFNIGLGLTAKGNVGIAKGSASAFGYLYFNHVKKAAKSSRGLFAETGINKFDNAPLMLIDNKVTAPTEDYARKNGINVIKEEILSGEGGTGSTYKVDRGVFRAGLQRAFKIGNYFGAQAAQVGGSEWKIFAIKPGFAISLSGDVGLVSLTGSISAVINFVNQNF